MGCLGRTALLLLIVPPASRNPVAAERVPVGSRFGVYSGGICDYSGPHSLGRESDDVVNNAHSRVIGLAGDLRLRPATKCNPVLNTARFSLDRCTALMLGTSAMDLQLMMWRIPLHWITDTKQPFRYLVIMDLEATCDFCPEPIVDASVNSEIIEFPWVRRCSSSLRAC